MPNFNPNDKASVQKLQDYLVSLGVLDKSYITGANSAGYGVYGPRTKAAIAAINKNGTANKEYNPFSMGEVKLNTNTSNPALSTGNINLGGNNYLTPEEFSALDKTYYDEQTPFYNAQQNYEIGGYDNVENNILNNYDLTRRDYEARAQEDFDTLNDTEGKNGTWASSERIKRRNNLQSKYNRSFEGAYNQNVDNLYKNRLDRAYNYGDSMVGNNSALTRYGVNFGDTTSSTNVLGSGGQYNPFGFQGRRNVERKQNARLGALNQLETFTYPYKFNQ